LTENVSGSIQCLAILPCYTFWMWIFAIKTTNGKAVVYQDSCGAINTRTSLGRTREHQATTEETVGLLSSHMTLGILQPGDSVWVQDAKTRATVIRQTDSPSSNEYDRFTDSPGTSLPRLMLAIARRTAKTDVGSCDVLSSCTTCDYHQ